MKSKKIALIIFSFIFWLFLTPSALATVNFKEVYTDPYSNLNWLEYSEVENTLDYPNSIAVVNEVYRLVENLPILNDLDWSVYMVKQKTPNSIFGEIGGYYYNNSITIFNVDSNSKAEQYIDHEIGHLIRRNFITNEELDKYITMRNDNKEHLNYFDKPEELFAEDFRWLFGTPSIKLNKLSFWFKEYAPWLSTYSEPREKEKQWILEHLK